MDTLVIKGMKFKAFHGYHDREKKEGNDFEIDLFLSLDLDASSQSDELSDTIDYSAVRNTISEVMSGESVNLIEHLVRKIGTRLSSDFPGISSFELRLRKLNPPMEGSTKYTEVRMSWPRS